MSTNTGSQASPTRALCCFSSAHTDPALSSQQRKWGCQSCPGGLGALRHPKGAHTSLGATLPSFPGEMCRGTESDMAQALTGATELVPVPSEGLVQGKGHPEPHGHSQEKLSQQQQGRCDTGSRDRGDMATVPVWQALPVQPGGQEHLPGKAQLPPFWHGSQQRAVTGNTSTASPAAQGVPSSLPAPGCVHTPKHTSTTQQG